MPTIPSLQPSPDYASLTTPRTDYSRGSQGRRKDGGADSEVPQSAVAAQALIDRVRLLEQRLLSTVTSQEYLETASSPSSPGCEEDTSIRGTFSKSRFFGQSHWMNSINQFSQVLGVIQRFEGDEKTDIRAIFDKCKGLARVAKARELVNQPLQADFCDYVPSRKISDQLVQAYLRTFESVYRVLHIPSFLQEYNHYWSNPRSANHDFVIKLLLVMAIGMGFSPDHNEPISLRSSSSQWICTAQSWLSSPFEKPRINVSGLQIHCLLLLARQMNAVGGGLTWISAGSLLSTAMHMGLHIDPAHSPKMSFFDAEMRRRLWASVLEIVVQSSMDAGGLPLISSQDIDCEPPSNIDDVQMDEGAKMAAAPKPADHFTQSSVQVALVRSLPIRLEIARFINDFRSDFSYAETLHLAARLSSLCRTNSLLFKSFRTDQSRPSAFQVKLLDLLTHRFLLALHYPFATKAKANPTFYFSRKVSLEVSLFLLSYPFPSRDSRPPHDDYARLRLLGTGLFRDVPLLATSTICAELINQLEEDKISFTPVASSLSRKELRKAIEDYVDLTASRIKHGETNVKGHVVFSCLLAQVDAMQSGLSVDQGVSNALRKSLDHCYRMLQSRTDENAVNNPLDSEATSNGRQADVVGVDGPQDWFPRDDLANEDFSIFLDSRFSDVSGCMTFAESAAQGLVALDN